MTGTSFEVTGVAARACKHAAAASRMPAAAFFLAAVAPRSRAHEERGEEDHAHGELEKRESEKPADAEHSDHYASEARNAHAAAADPFGASTLPDVKNSLFL